MLKVRDQSIAALYLGNMKITRAYLGTDVVFDIIPAYAITTSIEPAGSGTVNGSGSYKQGMSVTLQAVPASNYKFVAWKEGGTTVSENADYAFTVSSDRALVAVFHAQDDASNGVIGIGCIGIAQIGKGV